MASTPEQMFIMVKPDGVQCGLPGDVISRFEQRGFKLVALKMIHATEQHLESHYAEHATRPFFSSLAKYMSFGPGVGMVWEGIDAGRVCRVMLGATFPVDSDAGTIWGDHAPGMSGIFCHGSDTRETAEKEIALWFPDGVV